MIVSTNIDPDGEVTVTIDTDGDQGDGYSTDVLADVIERATNTVIATWFALHTEAEADAEAGE